jgi:hypothetical protein
VGSHETEEALGHDGVGSPDSSDQFDSDSFSIDESLDVLAADD